MNIKDIYKSISDHRFIVFADNHFNSLGLIRSLGEYGIRPDVMLIGSDTDGVIGNSKYPNSITYQNNVVDAIEYILKKYSGVSCKSFLLTGSDTTISIIDKYYDELKENFITFNCGKPNGINYLLSKCRQNELASLAGLNVPEYEEVNVGDLPQNVKYPIITKAVDSTIPDWKSLVYLCENEAELLCAYSKMDCKRIVLQHYIEKENETGFNAISVNNGHDVFLPLQLSYHYTEKTSFGDSIFLFKPTDEDLLSKINKLIELTSYSGIFSIDFLKGKDGKLYFLEINFRNSAWSYPYTRAGVNLPILWAASTIEGQLVTDGIRIKKLPFTSMVEPHILSMSINKGFTHFFRTVPKVLKSNSYAYWRTNDMGPIRFLIRNWFKRTFLRR